MEDKLHKAIEILCKELAKDKSEGSYYYSWQANIAMQFYDEFWRNYAVKEEYFKIPKSAVLEIANNAAKNFLDLLINK